MEKMHSINEEIIIEKKADYAIIMEKSYTLDIIFDYLNRKKEVKNLVKILNPIWGESIIYFDYCDKKFVVLSAKGSPVGVNAVERIKRTGGKYITLIGTCGSTDISIDDGSYILPIAAVRDEGVSLGYLDCKCPALANLELTMQLKNKLNSKGLNPYIGVAYTTDKRYKEDLVELKKLNNHLGVLYVDMETSAILLVSTYYNIKAAAIKVVTDCAVKETKGELKGIFDRNKNFIEFVNPKLINAFESVIETYVEL